MIGRRARPLDAALAVQAVVADARDDRRQLSHLVHDLARRRIAELALVQAQAAADAPRDVAGDVPVRARLADRRQCRTHPLDAPLTVGEGAFLLGERGGRQHDVRGLGGFLQEDVLDHQEIEVVHGVPRVVQVRLVQERVLADDVHRLQVASAGGFDHRGHGQTRGPFGHLSPGGAKPGAIGQRSALDTRAGCRECSRRRHSPARCSDRATARCRCPACQPCPPPGPG